MESLPDPLTRDQLLDLVRTEYAAWQAVLAAIDPSHLDIPLQPDQWSAKEHIFHITWYEQEMVRLIETRSLASGSPLWYQSNDDRNQIIYEENSGRSLDEVLHDAKETHDRLVTLLETLTDLDLSDPEQFSAMPADWQPWIIFAGNTFDHYRDHREVVQALLKS
jgi:hypothetical protein